jgi:protein-disulfide reductase (glutathione)
MLVIYADWCLHCRTLAPVFANADVQKLAEKLVMVHQNSDEDPGFLAKYASFGSYVPRILFITPDGAVKTELTSGNDRYPHFYTAEGIETLKTSMRRAGGG